MDRRTFLGTLALFSALAVVRRAAGASKLVVIVNAGNPVAHLGAGEIEALFTTRRLDWPGGARAVPFNFPARHPLREAFDQAALHFSPDEAARYWIDRRVRGGHPPPRQVPDVQTMLKVVASLEGAVGYVHKEDVTDKVRIVAEI
jgi:hypothetical protein